MISKNSVTSTYSSVTPTYSSVTPTYSSDPIKQNMCNVMLILHKCHFTLSKGITYNSTYLELLNIVDR